MCQTSSFHANSSHPSFLSSKVHPLYSFKLNPPKKPFSPEYQSPVHLYFYFLILIFHLLVSWMQLSFHFASGSFDDFDLKAARAIETSSFISKYILLLCFFHSGSKASHTIGLIWQWGRKASCFFGFFSFCFPRYHLFLISMAKIRSFGNFYLSRRFWWRQRKELTYPNRSLILAHPPVCASHRLTWWAGVGKALRWIFCCTENGMRAYKSLRSGGAGCVECCLLAHQWAKRGSQGRLVCCWGQTESQNDGMIEMAMYPFTRKNEYMPLRSPSDFSQVSFPQTVKMCVSLQSWSSSELCCEEICWLCLSRTQMSEHRAPGGAATWWSAASSTNLPGQCCSAWLLSQGMLHNKLMSALSPLSIPKGKPWEGFLLPLLTEVGFFPISEINVHCWHLNEDNSDVCYRAVSVSPALRWSDRAAQLLLCQLLA